MKIVLLATITAYCNWGSLHACEFVISLEEKVNQSNVVVIANVDKVILGNINADGQETAISYTAKSVLKGSIANEFTISARSVTYSIGNTSYSSTAGWSNYNVSSGKCYLLYLKVHNGNYSLLNNSQQYMETVDIENKRINDIGQTLKSVPYDDKIFAIRSIVQNGK